MQMYGNWGFRDRQENALQLKPRWLCGRLGIFPLLFVALKDFKPFLET